MADNSLQEQQKQRGRGRGRPFESGQSGNPPQVPARGRQRAAQAMQLLLETCDFERRLQLLENRSPTPPY
jgi:hypothetical protein